MLLKYIGHRTLRVFNSNKKIMCSILNALKMRKIEDTIGVPIIMKTFMVFNEDGLLLSPI